MCDRINIPVMLTVMMVLPGCGSNSTPEKLQGRFNAANAISDTSKRDSALITVAKDAAEVGNGEVAKNAVLKISNLIRRSSTAAEVAVALADAGELDAAAEVAKQIAETEQRNKILEQIADN